MRDDGSADGGRDGVVNDLNRVHLAIASEVLANSVKDHNRFIHRIAQYRQYRGQHRQGEFPLKVGKKAQDNNDVVQVGNDGGHRKFPFKAHCQIKHDANHHKGQSLQAVCRQLFTHLRAHILCAAHGSFCVLRFQGFHEFVTLLCRTHALLRRQANHHIARCAKVLDLHLGIA